MAAQQEEQNTAGAEVGLSDSSELLGVSDAKKNYPKLRARIEIRQHVSPQKLWHWSVIYDSRHVFSVSDSFTGMDQAIADAALHGGLALRRAMTPNTSLSG